jgi:hypothetical protein
MRLQFFPHLQRNKKVRKIQKCIKLNNSKEKLIPIIEDVSDDSEVEEVENIIIIDEPTPDRTPASTSFLLATIDSTKAALQNIAKKGISKINLFLSSFPFSVVARLTST